MVCALIKSFYYQATFLPPVKLTEDQLQKWTLKDGNEKAIQEQFKEQQVREYFSTPLTLEHPESENRAYTLQSKGWRTLSEKPLIEPGEATQFKPYYSVIERDELPGVIIKHGGLRKSEEAQLIGSLMPTGDLFDMSQHCSLFRIAMVERIQQACQKHPQALAGITLPEKHLCEITPGNHNLPVEQRFVIVAQKIDCLSMEETVDTIDQMSKGMQEALADKLALLVKETGFADASFSNIRLGKQGDLTADGMRRIYILDTEPSNLMILDSGIKNRFFTVQSSLEKSRRIGIHTLRQMDLKGETPKAPHFQKRLAEHAEASSSQYSPIKIGAHLIAILAMGALYKYYGTRKWKRGLIVTLLAPIEVGITRKLGSTVCGIMNIVKMQQMQGLQLQQPLGLVVNPEEKQRLQRLQRDAQWWGYYANWFFGEARIFITPEQIQQLQQQLGLN